VRVFYSLLSKKRYITMNSHLPLRDRRGIAFITFLICLSISGVIFWFIKDTFTIPVEGDGTDHVLARLALFSALICTLKALVDFGKLVFTKNGKQEAA
jgi:hypothetical protein